MIWFIISLVLYLNLYAGVHKYSKWPLYCYLLSILDLNMTFQNWKKSKKSKSNHINRVMTQLPWTTKSSFHNHIYSSFLNRLFLILYNAEKYDPRKMALKVNWADFWELFVSILEIFRNYYFLNVLSPLHDFLVKKD